jgi:SAM-dependent methyltransferase
MDDKQIPLAIGVDDLDLQTELRLLKRQALLFWPKEARTFAFWGLQDGMRVLEIGNGLGFVTEQLLALLPHSEITAIDSDPTMVARSHKLLRGQGGSRLHLRHGSIMATQLPDAHFDFVIVRFLLQHLQDPVSAVAEVRRVLRQGGRLAVVDADDDMWGVEDPPRPELRSLNEKLAVAQGQEGGNRRIGRQLLPILRDGGLDPVDFDAIAWHSDIMGTESSKVLADTLDPDTYADLEVSGLITPEELDNVRQADAKWLASNHPLMVCVAFVACGAKNMA